MNKSQVRFILGTPLLVDSFHSNRWDYFYQLRKQGEIINQRRVILDFEDDLLVRVRGDVVPKGQTAEDLKKKLEAEAKGKVIVEDEKTEAVDPNAPVIAPIEKPDIEAVEPADTQSSEANEAAATPVDSASDVEGDKAPASILAVPVPVVPPLSAQPDEKIKSQTTSEEVEAPQAQEEETATPTKVEVDAGRSQTELVAPVAEPIASDPQPAAKQLKPRNTETGKTKVFIMDNQLDTTRIQNAPAEEVETETTNSVVQEIKDNNQDVVEEEPDFFERMLEKIGF
jgi:outer membrane protein assembly factor BamE